MFSGAPAVRWQPAPRWSKVLRDLWGNKTRTLLVVLSIAVGVFAIGAITSTRSLLAAEMTAAHLATTPASAMLFIGDFDDELVRKVRRMDGVAEAEGRRMDFVRIQVGPDRWTGLGLQSFTDFEDMRLDRIRPVAGAWPPDRGDLLVERAFFAKLNANIGDTVVVETPDGKRHELTVSGLVHDTNTPGAAFTDDVFGYVTRGTLEALGRPRTYTDLRILVAERPYDPMYAREVAESVKRRLEAENVKVGFVHVPEPGKHSASVVVDTFLPLLGVLGSLSLLLSGLLVVNTVSAVLTQQARQIGAMKAIGARGHQLVGMYLGMVLAYGVLALLIAVPLGALGAYALTMFLGSLVNVDISSTRIPAETLLLEVATGLLVPVGAAAWPVASGLRATVREAIAGYGVAAGAFGGGRFDRLLERLTRRLPLVPRPLLLSLRNTFRRKARLALTMFTLTLGGAIFIGVLTVYASLLRTQDDTLAVWAYDVSLDFRQAERVEQVELEAMQVPGVAAVESWGTGAARRLRPDGTEGPGLLVLAPPADTALLKPAVLAGRWLTPADDDGIVLDAMVWGMEPDLKVGDEVTLVLDGRTTTWRLVGIVRGARSGPTVYANYDSFASASKSAGRAATARVATEGRDPASHQAVAAALKEHFDAAGLEVNETTTISAMREGEARSFRLVTSFLVAMAVLLAVVGALGLMGTMGINVLERAREIGVMRAIGATNGAVRSIFLAEGMLIGALSWALAVPLSLAIGFLLGAIVGDMFLNAPLAFAFSPGGAALWLAVVLVLAAAASLLPSWRASRLTVREVLAYE